MRGKKIKVVIATSIVLGILCGGLGVAMISSKASSTELTTEVTNEVKEVSFKPEGAVIEEYEGVTIEKVLAVCQTIVQDVVTSINGLIRDNDGRWYYYVDGQVQRHYTGIQKNKLGYWYVRNGMVDFSANGLYKVAGTWYYLRKGQVQINYSGLKKNSKGWFYVNKGIIDFKATGFAKNKNGDYYYVVKGKLDDKATGLRKNRSDGKWYYVDKGKHYPDYEGIVEGQGKGKWYVRDGVVQLEETGVYIKLDDKEIDENKGQVRYYYINGRVHNKRSKIITEGLQYVGNKYIYGGTDLLNGIDCSAFTRAMYNELGIMIPRNSAGQSTQGELVENIEDAKPGDLIFYAVGDKVCHVALYIGNGQIVHASNSAEYPKGGIKVQNAEYREIYCIKTFSELDK